MSKKQIDQNYLLRMISLMREDIEDVMDVLDGKGVVTECWDTSSYNNWVAMQNLLCDIYDYIDCVHEDEDGSLTFINDDIPPDDEIDESEVGDDYKAGSNG